MGKGNGADDREIIDLIRKSFEDDRLRRQAEFYVELARLKQRLSGKPSFLPLRIALVFVTVFVGMWIIFKAGNPPSLVGKSIFLFEPPEGLYIEPGKITFINFFASWCSPCEKEMPDLVRFSAQRAEEVDVVGVPVNDSVSEVEKFVARFNVNFPVLTNSISENERFFKRLGGSMIPMTVVVDGRGYIVKVIRGPVDFHMLEEILREVQSAEAPPSMM